MRRVQSLTHDGSAGPCHVPRLPLAVMDAYAVAAFLFWKVDRQEIEDAGPGGNARHTLHGVRLASALNDAILRP